VTALQAEPSVQHTTCVTAQHREMLDQVLATFKITPEIDLNVMKPNQALADVTSAVLSGVCDAVERVKPDWLIVQGDTTTAFAGALAAFYNKVRVAHVEAGLRTGNLYSPWPEEANRRLVSQLTTIHFAPTRAAADNLLREGTDPSSICVTGNTVVDALQWVDHRLSADADFSRQSHEPFKVIDRSKKLILVTGHRRENFDGGLARVCQALARIAERPDVEVVYPLHLNPNVRAAALSTLGNRPNVHLMEPLHYAPFVALMRMSHFILTDSGGIQEEAPSLGKPVLVTRETTERPEAIAAGNAKLIGTSIAEIVAGATDLLDDPGVYSRMSRVANPFGDGKASQRIIERLLR
jgi:UDP-N-acetylglucosamine 2-epimerase (non-hydrolysing)